jgi:hypothetical protein
MRIVKRQELMTLPPGTLYCDVLQPWIFGTFCVKGDTIQWDGKNADFWERNLDSVDAWHSGEMCDRLDEMGADSTVSYPVQAAPGRYGLYDDEAMFLVYEPADVNVLRAWLNGDFGDED